MSRGVGVNGWKTCLREINKRNCFCRVTTQSDPIEQNPNNTVTLRGDKIGEFVVGGWLLLDVAWLRLDPVAPFAIGH